MQEVRNAVDQTARELATRFDFKGTGATVELGTNEITHAGADRGPAGGPPPGARGEARPPQRVAEGDRLRQGRGGVGRHGPPDSSDRRRHLLGEGPRGQQGDQGARPQGHPVPDPGRPGAGHRQEARRPPGGDQGAEGAGPRRSRSSSRTSGTELDASASARSTAWRSAGLVSGPRTLVPRRRLRHASSSARCSAARWSQSTAR